MKPLSLQFCGINSFSEPAAIDFESLTEVGIFGIFGDTGSGKSTILDTIGFALYGGVSRSRTGSLAEIVNYRCDRAFVRFEFEIFFEGRRRRFRVERELKKKNAVQTVRVYDAEENVALAEGVRESNALLERIIGLEQKDFEKCIALPQGEFAQFVKAQRSDRLKLVSRLFDLEEYGERLVKRANARCAALEGERNIAAAKLEPFLSLTKELLDSLGSEIERLEKEEREARRALEAARAEERSAEEAFRRGRELLSLQQRQEEMDRMRGEIDALERELGRIGHAAAAVSAQEELAQAERAVERARTERECAERKIALAQEKEKELAAFDAERAEEEIARLSGERARAEHAEELFKRKTELERRLKETRRAYAEEADQYRDFSYEREKEELGRALSALGEGDFFSFAEEHGKAALLRREYAQFSDELSAIAQKYPETEGDVMPLAERYGALSKGEQQNFSELRSAFERREKARREAHERLLGLEKRNGGYRAHLQRLEQLQTEGLRLKEELGAMQLPQEMPALPQIEQAIAARKRERRENALLRERTSAELSEARSALAAACEREKSALEGVDGAKRRLGEALSRGGFASKEEASSLALRAGSLERARGRVTAFREEDSALRARSEELKKEPLPEISQEALQKEREKREALEKAQEERVRALAVKRAERERENERFAKKRELEKEYARIRREAELAERLKKLLEGNKFMEFVAEEYLQSVTENGSERLLSLTSGRYFLRYNGGFFVGDNLNDGALRGVYTLSGGETFLVSLSLALALSSEICLKSLRPIEFFFLDEGFGTLDERLVDTVMDSLEKLRSEHFCIGIISHVEELKHRIEKKIIVEKATEQHGSRIDVS